MSRFVLLLLILALAVGCDAPVESFDSNEVYSLVLTRSRSVPAAAAQSDAAVVTEALFGTPNDPRWPAESMGSAELVDVNRLQRAAGAVASGKDGTHQGLYREHCVTCHGLSGSGTGPASLFQNPHPRDFRHGVFKWKSTTRAAKPTRDDLVELLRRGVPGTAMPSFAALDTQSDPDTGDADIDALVDYVIYLAVRGEVERRLMAAAIDELDYGQTPPAAQLRLSASGDSDGAAVVREVLQRVAGDWQAAVADVVAVPAYQSLNGPTLAASIDRGREIFHGPIANCAGCHGPAGNGLATVLDYDDWGKEYSTRLGLTPSDREAMRPFRSAGALKPRPSQPRNLQSGVFRGGGDPDTLYRRITTGIAGTPMPAVEVVSEADGKGLTSDQVWDLVRYLSSLSP